MKRMAEKRSKTLAVPHCVEECSMSSPSYYIKEWTQESDVRNTTRTSFVQTSDFPRHRRIKLWGTNRLENTRASLYRASCVFYITWLQHSNQTFLFPGDLQEWLILMLSLSYLFLCTDFFFLMNSFSSKMNSTQSNNDSYSASSGPELAENKSLCFW